MPAVYESLKAVIDSIDAIIYVADMKTYELLLINNYTRRLFGDIEGDKCWASLQQGQTGPCDYCSNSKLVGANGMPLDTYVWEFKNTVNGRWYECRDKAISWRDGRIVRLEIATDITERKLAEERQRESEEQFRLIYERSPLGMAFVNAEGFLTDCNDKFLEIAGAPREKLIGFNMKTGVRDEQVKSRG